MEIKMKMQDACRKVLMVIIGLTSVCTVVFSNTRVSVFRVATFQNGKIIVINGGITSVLTCFRTCGDTCGYVQYRADDTCVLYSDADLVTKSAAVEGAIWGYRKIVPRVRRYVGMFSKSILTYDEAQVECEKIGSGLAIVRNQSDYDSLINTINTSDMLLHIPKSTDYNVYIRYTRAWISGMKTTGEWQWYTGEPIPEAWFWAPGENDQVGTACARVIIDVNPFEIRDRWCDDAYMKIICE